MIKNIYVFSKAVIRRIIEDQNYFLNLNSDWALISIYGSPTDPAIKNKKEEQELKDKGCSKILYECFGDYTKTDLEYFQTNYTTAANHVKVITIEQAKEIVHFIDSVNLQDTTENLVIHCHAGISRSGAVGLFACRYLKLHKKNLVELNKIHSNTYVLDLLSKVSGIKKSYKLFWKKLSSYE